MKHSHSYNAGADDERQAWMKKLRLIRGKVSATSGDYYLLTQLLIWGKDRPARTAKRKGGLGRK